jgi:IS5 family transposase
MLGKSPQQKQKNLFAPLLREIVNPGHELVLLSNKINWKNLEEKLSDHYSHTGQPSKPVRLMAGLLILKQMYNYGDETIVEAWIQNPYYQYFCGEDTFKWTMPCDPSDLVHFRKRIGEKGIRLIFEISAGLHEEKIIKAKGVNIDTTAQEKNITYPTDSKLYKKIIYQCWKIAATENIQLRQSYKITLKKLMNILRFSRSKQQLKQARKALRKLKTIAGRLVRDVSRNLQHNTYNVTIEIFNKILAQQKHDKNKIYSIHEPQVACIAKGKQHKPYEFGNKIAIATTAHNNIIVGVESFTGNPHDSKTLEPVLKNAHHTAQKQFDYASVDKGFRGKTKIGNTQIIIPDKNNRKLTRSKRRKLKNRTAIEPIISHVKHDYRMLRNYLSGIEGDTINALLACAAFNFKAALRELKDLFWLYFLSALNFKFSKLKVFISY